jgi:hypothetical protein
VIAGKARSHGFASMMEPMSVTRKELRDTICDSFKGLDDTFGLDGGFVIEDGASEIGIHDHASVVALWDGKIETRDVAIDLLVDLRKEGEDVLAGDTPHGL